MKPHARARLRDAVTDQLYYLARLADCVLVADGVSIDDRDQNEIRLALVRCLAGITAIEDAMPGMSVEEMREQIEADKAVTQ